MEVRSFGVAIQARAERRSFSEALCFGDPGVEYELHRWAEEVGPEGSTRTQGRAVRTKRINGQRASIEVGICAGVLFAA